MRILVTGIARSGTTWVSTILSSARNVEFIDEPDNPEDSESAKRYIGHNPIIAPYTGKHDGRRDLSLYAGLWMNAFDVGNEAVDGDQRHILCKSIAIPHCVEWVCQIGNVDKVIWVVRNPLNTISSWYNHDIVKNDGEPLSEEHLKRLAWLYGHKYTAMLRLMSTIDGDMVYPIQYETAADLTKNGDYEMWEYLMIRLGLSFNRSTLTRVIEDLMRPGDEIRGHPEMPEYNLYDHIHRSEEQIDSEVWKRRMTEKEADILSDGIRKWGIKV